MDWSLRHLLLILPLIAVCGCSGSSGIVQTTGYLKASNTDRSDAFGSSVGLSADGRTLAVGAAFEQSAAFGVNGDQADNTGPHSGAAYIYVRGDDGIWSLQAYLKSFDTQFRGKFGLDDHFGASIALSADGNTVAVGADCEAGPDILDFCAGAVYVFVRNGDNWYAQSRLTVPIYDSDQHFGWSLAINADGSTLAVGTPGDGSAATGINGDPRQLGPIGAGAVHVFVNVAGVWSEQAYVKASNTNTVPADAKFRGSGGQFGESVALSADGSTLAVGAIQESSPATGVNGDQHQNDEAAGAGAVYVFTRDNLTWSQQAYIKASNTAYGQLLGMAVALSADGDTLAAGAVGESSIVANSGAVYLYSRRHSTWTQDEMVKASNPEAVSYFGGTLALGADGTVLVVGNEFEASAAVGINHDQSDVSAPLAGAAYVYIKEGSAWNQSAYVKASNTDPNDMFGSSVALDADATMLAVGASGEGSAATGFGGNQADNSAPGSGAVYLY